MLKRINGLFLLLLLCVMVSCAASPADRWFQQRSLLTTTTALMIEAHESGLISDQELVETVDPAIQSARSYLNKAFLRLPEGGDEFDSFMDALDAILITLAEIEKKEGGS